MGRGCPGERLAVLCQALPDWGPCHPTLACFLTWRPFRGCSFIASSPKPVRAGAAACRACEIGGLGQVMALPLWTL